MTPQFPQLFESDATSRHAAPHFLNPAAHENPQAPAAQTGAPFGGAEHTLPHAPQFDVSILVSTQDPPQSVVSIGQTRVQAPSEQA
jgi:hypothetical protein